MPTLLSLAAPLLDWVQSTAIAQAVAQSLYLTGILSSIHLVGLMLVVGGALVSGLRMLGLLLVATPISAVTAPAGRGMLLGLFVSTTTGLLLVAPRALPAAENGFFQIKMLLLFAAVVLHVTLYRRVTRQEDPRPLTVRITGALALALWGGVAAAGCAYILLEY